MGNTLTYLSDYGQDSFEARPFCDIDNLILASLSYLDFEGILSGCGMTVEKSAALYALRGENRSPESLKRLPPMGDDILFAMAKTNRFQKLRLSRYVDVFDKERQTQFAALLIELGDGTAYVSYRGTDQSICGWQESFSLCCQTVAAQYLAADYLIRTARTNSLSFRIGGHSKGGNLAMYAAMMAPEDVDERIIAVYNNDGPGFAPDLPWAVNFEKIQGRTTRITPEFSVIGLVYAQASRHRIVGSSGKGLEQHGPLTWVTDGCDFAEKGDLTPACKYTNGYLHRWVDGAALEYRSSFIHDFFGAFYATGAEQMDDISKLGLKGKMIVFSSLLTSSIKTKNVILRFAAAYVRNLFSEETILMRKSPANAQQKVASASRHQIFAPTPQSMQDVA